MSNTARLKVISGFVSDRNLVISEDTPFTIGRDRRRDLPIMSRKVSRNHAQIRFVNNSFIIEDVGSKQGVQVNGKKVESSKLRTGDVIQIANVKLEFQLENEQPRGPRPTPVPGGDRGAPLIDMPRPTPPPEPAPVILRPKPRKGEKVDETPSGIAIRAPAFTDEERRLVGETISDVRLIATLNRGRHTVIYKGIQDARNRVVALKILRPDAAEDPDVLNWFIEGAKIAGVFRHEDAVSLLGGGRSEGKVFVYSRFMDGGSAEDRFARATDEGLAAVKRALETVVHVARALEYASGKGLLHKGVRPAKILYDEKRHVRLNGIGFNAGPKNGVANLPGDIAAYLAPEQIGGGGDLTLRTDIFGLGASFYYMLTGRAPQRDARQRMLSPKVANPQVPDSICRIIEKMVAPDPANRYNSYGQLLHDVRWALRGEAWPHT